MKFDVHVHCTAQLIYSAIMVECTCVAAGEKNGSSQESLLRTWLPHTLKVVRDPAVSEDLKCKGEEVQTKTRTGPDQTDQTPNKYGSFTNYLTDHVRNGRNHTIIEPILSIQYAKLSMIFISRTNIQLLRSCCDPYMIMKYFKVRHASS